MRNEDSTVGEGARLCVLLVEDSDADAYLIERALGDNARVGRVVRARDGQEAISLIEQGEVKPDLALVDLHMPRMNGFNLLVALASEAGTAFPAVVLTSSSAPRDATRSRLRRAVRVLTKPDSVTEMHTVLAAAIDAVCVDGAMSRDRPPHRRLADGEENRDTSSL